MCSVVSRWLSDALWLLTQNPADQKQPWTNYWCGGEGMLSLYPLWDSVHLSHHPVQLPLLEGYALISKIFTIFKFIVEFLFWGMFLLLLSFFSSLQKHMFLFWTWGVRGRKTKYISEIPIAKSMLIKQHLAEDWRAGLGEGNIIKHNQTNGKDEWPFPSRSLRNLHLYFHSQKHCGKN